MTSDQVYRRALSRERALAELFEFAGTQFDPRLVQEFCGYVNADQVRLQSVVARRWLKDLQPAKATAAMWQLSATGRSAAAASSESAVLPQAAGEHARRRACSSTARCKIVLWNRAAERLTGIPRPASSTSTGRRRWSNLRDEQGKLIDRRRMPGDPGDQDRRADAAAAERAGRGGQRVEVDAHLVPVHGKSGVTHGAALLLHDASQQITLEQRIQSLHEQATRDPLTQVANRAEFDRILANCVESHLERRHAVQPDPLRHRPLQADQRHLRPPGRRRSADHVRRAAAAALPLGRPGGPLRRRRVRACSAPTATTPPPRGGPRSCGRRSPSCRWQPSSGKSHLGQLRRHRGAKRRHARNDAPPRRPRPVPGQIQRPQHGRAARLRHRRRRSRAQARRLVRLAPRRRRPSRCCERTLATSVPFNVVVEKMRGFVADHHAQIDSVTENYLVLKIEGEQAPAARRSTDRPVPFVIEMRFDESTVAEQARHRRQGRPDGHSRHHSPAAQPRPPPPRRAGAGPAAAGQPEVAT